MFYVIEELDCPTCGGQGWVTHPAWELYYEENGDLGILNADGHPDMALDETWFREQGYDYPPDEEIPCTECEGGGRIQHSVTLKYALEALFGKDHLTNLTQNGGMR